MHHPLAPIKYGAIVDELQLNYQVEKVTFLVQTPLKPHPPLPRYVNGQVSKVTKKCKWLLCK